jgi:O-antigen ligase
VNDAPAPGRWVELLASCCLVALAARPPLVFEEWAWLPDVLLALAATAAAGAAPTAPRPAALVLALGLAGALWASHLAAPDRGASWHALAHAARLGLAVSLGGALAARTGFAGRLALTLACGGALASAHAALQVLVLHPALAAQAGNLPRPFAAQLLDGRGNSVFILPAHLGAFVAMAAVLGAAVALYGAARRLVRAGAAAATVACVAGLYLSGSVGGALLLLGGGAVMAACAGPGRRRLAVGVVAVVVAVGALAASAMRRAPEIAAENPGSARAANWRAAVTLVREAPWLGRGGGSFAREYQRVRDPAANDARHAHQAYLELAAEHGVPALALVLAAVAALVVRAGRASRRGDSRVPGVLHAGLCGAGAAALAHGLLDFGWSDPTWAVPAAGVVGACWGASQGARPPLAGSLPGWRVVSGMVVAALAAVLVADSVVLSAVAVRVRSALGAARLGMHDEALARLRSAEALDPLDSDVRVAASSALLALSRQAGVDADALVREAVDEARRAVLCSPRRAVAHDALARALLLAGQPEDALRHAERAVSLAPHARAHADRRDEVRRALGLPPAS